MEDDDDLFAELCGVTVTSMEDAKEDDNVLLQELCLEVERATIESRGDQIMSAMDKLQSVLDLSAPQRLLDALLLGKQICDGQYADVVRSSIGQRIVAVMTDRPHSDDDHLATTVIGVLDAYVDKQPSETDRWAASYEILHVGVALLSLYVQANYTGPAFDVATLKDVIANVAHVFHHNEADVDMQKLHREALLVLQVDGESPYTICEFPYFLALGRAVLSFVGNATHTNWSHSVDTFGTSDEDEDVPATPVVTKTVLETVMRVNTGVWWNARAAVAHQRLMISKDPSNTLWYEARRGFVKTIRHRTLFAFDRSEYLLARATVEWGLAQNYFDKNKMGKATFQKAHEISGLSVQLSGSMGKRTKYQQKSTAQMILLAASKYPPPQSTSEEATSGSGASIYATAMAESTHAEFGGRKQTATEEGETLTEEEERILQLVQDGEASYRDIALDQVDQDNILLEKIAFEDTQLTEQGNLQTMDQVILLALCLDVKNSNPHDGLTREEMHPYVTRVLENPNNWMVYSTGLLERAWIEFESYKRRERSVLQMQALVDQHTTRLTVLQNSLKAIEDAAPAHERMAFVHALAFPPRYALKHDLAERYLGMGIVRSALEICLELELWDEVVKCYQIIDQPTKAEKLVRERLEVAPSPYMWTSLGDITGEIVHYETAWEVSRQRYARAKRSLGRHFFEQGEYPTAVRHYQDSVRVNPMHGNSWFILGTMSMRLQDWDLAQRALTRVVQLEPDNGEAWGNLGSIHLTNGRYAEAFSVFQEALKQKREMWQMWENYAFCAIHIERYGEAMYALHQWLDRREKHKRVIDHELLAWLVEGIVYPHELEKLKTTEAHGDEDDDGVDVSSLSIEDDEEDLGDLDEAAIATDKSPPISNANYKKQLALLFGRITSIVTNSAKIWQVYARFNDGVGRKEKALDCRLKQCRALQSAGWEKEQRSVEELCKAAVRLSADYIAEGSKKSLYSCRLYIRGLLKKAQMDFADLDATKALAETLEQVETLEKQL